VLNYCVEFLLRIKKKKTAPTCTGWDSGLVKKLLSFCCLTKTLFEGGYAATGIEDALLAGIERVTDGANFNINRACALCGAGCENLAATAGNGRLNIFWMNLWLHGSFLSMACWVGNPVNQRVKGTRLGPYKEILKRF
jgi:hypothetical protein